MVGAMAPVLSRSQALEMQGALIKRLSDPAFQERLHSALLEADGDPQAQMKVRHELCLPEQAPVVKKFGFDSVADSMEAFNCFSDADPEIFANRCRLAELVKAERDRPQGMQKFLGALVSYHVSKSSDLDCWNPSRQISNDSALTISTQAPSGSRSLSPAMRRSRSLSTARFQRASSRAARCVSKRASSLPRFELALPMTHERVLAMHRAMIKELSKLAFQDKLAVVLQAAEHDPVEQSRLRQKMCLPIQNSVAREFGYRNVAELLSSFPPQLRADPEIASRIEELNSLVHVQNCCAASPATAQDRGCDVALHKCGQGGTFEALLNAQPGRRWRVVGGCTKGGIIVRRGKELSSPQLGTRARPVRLAFDSVVEELDLYSERLHYRKISGEGPDFGWVSVLALGGETLLEPLED